MSRNHTTALKLATIALCSATLVAVVFAAAAWIRRPALPADQLEVMRLVHHRILEDYVFDRDPEQLMYRAIEGMVSSLDDYSRFVPPGKVREFEGHEITGTYDGIGVLLIDRDPLTVRWPFPGGPAEAAGVQVGDRIVAIAGDRDIAFENAADKLRGPSGSPIQVTLERDGEEIGVEVRRGPVRRPPVKWTQLVDPQHRIGYLHIAEFQKGMVSSFDLELEYLRELAGQPLGGLILDMRGNPGGLLEEAVALSNRFLQKGTIVSLKKRGDEVVETHAAKASECTVPDTPVVILIDRSSASAAEVFSAALQEHGRAQLVGERSYGKGVVQQIYHWPGRDFRLKMTSSHYYTPNGRNLSKTLRRGDDGEDPGGVDPDRMVKLTSKDSRRTRILLARNETPRAYREAERALAAKLEFEVTDPLGKNDPCIAAALEILLGADEAPKDEAPEDVDKPPRDR